LDINEWVRKKNLNLVISKGGDILWPACSPDLSVCDYFLWGYLQCNEYLTKPSDTDELKNAIKEEMTATPDNMLRKAMSTLRDRLEQCRRDGGTHLRDVIFRK
jgi:hypothetical protein